jgi:serine/threonine protein kinase
MIKGLHDIGIIHCDLKPDNILTHREKSSKDLGMNELFDSSKPFYLIDYGISKKFQDDYGDHIERNKEYTFKGNLLFTSRN